MPDDAPRPGLLEIIAGLSGLLDDLDRVRLTRHLRAPGPSVDVDDVVEVLSIAAHDLDAIAEDLTLPWERAEPAPLLGNSKSTDAPLAYRRPNT